MYTGSNPSELYYITSRNIFNETSNLWNNYNFIHDATDNVTSESKILYNVTYQVCQIRLTSRTITALVLFTIIFCLAVIGNCMVIVTIVQNRWMRTVTNLFLLNLAISDLLLALICMPPTLIGRILFKCFLWGPVICKAIAYMQPVSVAACSFTLMAIAFERYNAICRPLHSRHWKTKKHALLMICSVWSLSFCCTMPSVVTSQLAKIEPGRYNCREHWPNVESQLAYLSFLTFCLLIIPLVVMAVLYSLVINTLWQGIQLDIQGTLTGDGETNTFGDEVEINSNKNGSKTIVTVTSYKSPTKSDQSKKVIQRSQYSNLSTTSTNTNTTSCQTPISNVSSQNSTHRRTAQPEIRQNSDKTILRSTHTEQNLSSKKRVIKMLAAIVAEFFICWTPLYAYQFYLMAGGDENADLALTFLILSYLSACTNPVTYCFMNGKFRNSFLIAFGCGCFVKNSYQYSKAASTYVPTSLMTQATKQFSEGKRRLSVRRNATLLGQSRQNSETRQTNSETTRNGFENCPKTISKKSLTVKLLQPISTTTNAKSFNSNEITTTTAKNETTL